MKIHLQALKAAFPYTIPIMAGFLCLGISFGLLMTSKGFSSIYPIFMSIIIFAGSMQFVAITILLAAFNPLYALILTLMINARHMFYGISMLDKLKDIGPKKYFIIWGMCDETFSINCSFHIPKEINSGWFMFYVTLLNYFYWILGTTIGSLLGENIHFNTNGIDFVMTALFLVIFINQWKETQDHIPAMIGILGSILSILIFGTSQFIIPAMLFILVALSLKKNSLKKEKTIHE